MVICGQSILSPHCTQMEGLQYRLGDKHVPELVTEQRFIN